MTVASGLVRSVSSRIAAKIFGAIVWTLLAAFVCWMYWARTNSEALPLVAIRSGSEANSLAMALSLGFFVFSVAGAIVRLILSGWWPRFNFNFAGPELVYYDSVSRRILGVNRHSWIDMLGNFVVNGMLGVFVAITSWAVMEVVLQLLFLLRALIAPVLGVNFPSQTWPRRNSRQAVALSYGALLVAIGLTVYDFAHVSALSRAAAPGPQGCGTAVVQGVAALALREAPSVTAQRLLPVRRGQPVELLCEASVVADGIAWQKVQYGSTAGWMSLHYLQRSER